MNLSIQPNIYPFLFLNDLIDISDKTITMPINDDSFAWVYNAHWPEKPNIPASIQIETMTQAAAMYIFHHYHPSHVYVREFIRSKFYRMIIPGLNLTISLKLVKHNRALFYFDGSIFDPSSQKVYTKSSFVLINPEFTPNI